MSASRQISTTANRKSASLAELLSLDDADFVNAAYLTFFNRIPDPEGLGNYIEMLRSGVPKIQIARDLRLSGEGVANAVTLPGLPVLLSFAVVTPLAAGKSPVTSIDQLLAMKDRAFVSAAYQFLLRRDVDKQGMSAYLARVRAGERKLNLLSDLRNCAESKYLQARLEQWHRFSEIRSAAHADGAHPARELETEGGSGSCALPAAERLFAMSRADFIETAHVGLLARKPHSDELAATQEKLQSGVSRQLLLAEVWKSEDASALRNLLTALDQKAWQASLAGLPVLGRLFRLWMGIEGDTEPERRLRRMENQLAIMEELLRSQTPDVLMSEFDNEPQREADQVAVQPDASEEITLTVIKPARSAATLLRTIARGAPKKNEKDHV